MLQVGCGSVGLILVCAISTIAAHAAQASPKRMRFIIVSLLPRPRNALHGFRYRPDTFEEKSLNTSASIRFGGIEVSARVRIQVMNTEELPRLSAAVTE